MTHDDIAAIVATAQQRYAKVLTEASTADTRAFYDYCRDRSEARQANALDEFERRYQFILARGGVLAALVEAESALQQAREWARLETAA